MSTLGGRLGLAALKVAGGRGEILKLVCSSRTCALDGIAETTGCNEDNGTLEVRSDGRHALQVITCRGSTELRLSEAAMAHAGRYRTLCNRLERNWDELDEEEQARRRAEMDAMLDEILPHFWQAGDGELLVVEV